jgi:serine/threonine protein kinase/Tol biopolymer transport system component
MDVLGQGGMGSVYRVIDENLGVEVAVKENLYTTEEYSRQFRLEAIILASMRNPNLPRVFDHFEIDGQGQYLVMDYIEGEDLRQRMDRVGILPDEDVIVMGAAICDALEFLHTRVPPILHRDIKPGNIKINPQGEVYLVDFGLAKIDEGNQATTAGARAMTPGYSSPEQYGTARTDARSDIYSLGATLYAVLTATIPEDGLARAMEQIDLTPLRKRNPRISRKLAKVLEKALAIHPDDRFQTASEFKLALLASSVATKQRLEGGELTIPPPPEGEIKENITGKVSKPTLLPEPKIEMSGESIARLRRRRGHRFRQFVKMIGIGSVIIIGALFYYLMSTGSMPEVAGLSLPFGVSTFTPNSTTPISPTLLPTSPLSENPSIEPIVSPTQSPQPSPTSTPTEIPLVEPTELGTIEATPTETPLGGGAGQLAFVSDRTGIPQIWVVNSDGTGLLRLTDIEGGACQPAWSPDGTQLAFISPCSMNNKIYFSSNLFLMNADGTGITSMDTEIGSFDPAWSPDGASLLFVRAIDAFKTQIYRIDLIDSSIHLMTDNQKLNLNPEWSPDGSRFVFSSTRVGGQALWIQVNDPDVEPLLLTRSGERLNSFPSWSRSGDNIVFSQQPEIGGVPRLLSVSYDMLGIPAEGYIEERISNGMIVPEDEPDISHDGLWIVFESWPDGENHDIYIYSPPVLLLIRITFDPSEDFDPAWRPIWQ